MGSGWGGSRKMVVVAIVNGDGREGKGDEVGDRWGLKSYG